MIKPSPVIDKSLQIKFIIKKIVALALIISPMFHTYKALRDIFIIFPTLNFMGDPAAANSLYYQLIKKGLILSLGLVLDSVYGFSLLIKPNIKTTYLNIAFGAVLFIISIYLFHFANLAQIVRNLHFLPVS